MVQGKITEIIHIWSYGHTPTIQLGAIPSKLVISIIPSIFTLDPFLRQPSQFILAWDRHRNMLHCILPWEVNNNKKQNWNFLAATAQLIYHVLICINFSLFCRRNFLKHSSTHQNLFISFKLPRLPTRQSDKSTTVYLNININWSLSKCTYQKKTSEHNASAQEQCRKIIFLTEPEDTFRDEM